MKVYVAEYGAYSDRWVGGVYDSPERAMADSPGETWTQTTWMQFPDWPDRSKVLRYTDWSNGLKWDDAVRVYALDYKDHGPLRSPDRRLVQRYRESDGGWEFDDDVSRCGGTGSGAATMKGKVR